jgi:hypothetical protein
MYAISMPRGPPIYRQEHADTTWLVGMDLSTLESSAMTANSENNKIGYLRRGRGRYRFICTIPYRVRSSQRPLYNPWPIHDRKWCYTYYVCRSEQGTEYGVQVCRYPRAVLGETGGIPVVSFVHV